MYKRLEHTEHAGHLAHSGEHGHGGADPDTRRNQLAALLVAVLAAALAITEQGAKHAEIRVQQSAILATDAWAQYQAKSTRGTFSKDIADLVTVLEPSGPELTVRRAKFLESLKQDQERYERDPKDGKGAIAKRAKAFENDRDHALEQTHTYHNGAAAVELGIVLSTASAIIKSRMLLLMALGFGVGGIGFALFAWLAQGGAAAGGH